MIDPGAKRPDEGGRGATVTLDATRVASLVDGPTVASSSRDTVEFYWRRV